MAIIHRATLTPSKLELLQAYLPSVPSLATPAGAAPQAVGAYRFDDPAGVVGIETHLLAGVGDTVLHVPLTYRSAPLDGARDWLVGRMEHSVLGPRLAYLGVADPVYWDAIARTITTGGTQVAEMVQTDDGEVERDPSARVRGSGGGEFNAESAAAHLDRTTIVIESTQARLVVNMIVDAGAAVPETPHLTGTWQGQDTPALLAHVS